MLKSTWTSNLILPDTTLICQHAKLETEEICWLGIVNETRLHVRPNTKEYLSLYLVNVENFGRINEPHNSVDSYLL